MPARKGQYNMKKTLKIIEMIMNGFEVMIAILLLAIIAVRVFELTSLVLGNEIEILHMEFDRVLSLFMGLVIGIEFTKMLCKQTPESVLDVLLFALARHLVIYNDRALDLLIGVIAIAGLFATKKYLQNHKKHKEKKSHESDNNLEEIKK